MNTLARWQEKYHLTASNQRVVRIGEEAASSTSGEAVRLRFDQGPRLSCRERLFAEIPGLTDLADDTVAPLLSLWDQRFAIARVHKGKARLEWAGDGFALAKEVAAVPDAAALRLSGELRTASPGEGWLAVEWTLGIAGGQTGVYPLDSPGGWQLIGRTRLTLFDPAGAPTFLFAPGDEVQFVVAEGSAVR